MPRWVCRGCGCLYTPGAPCCPQCRESAHGIEGAAEPAGQEDDVPKIDRFGVATIGSVSTVHASAILPDGAVSRVPVPAPEVKPAPTEPPAEETVPAEAAPEPEVPPKAAAKPAPPPPAKPATAAPPKKAANG